MREKPWKYTAFDVLSIILLFSCLISLLMAGASSVASGSSEGKRLYLSYCAACHGIDGTGSGKVIPMIKKKPPDLTKSNFLIRKTDKVLKEAINGDKGRFHGNKYIKSMKIDFTEGEVFEIINYIRSFQPAFAGNPVEGRKLYVLYCASCHGRGGRADGEKSMYLDVQPHDQSDNAYMSSKTDEQLFKAIKSGGDNAHSTRFMPQWKGMLRPREIWDLVSYIRILHRGKKEEGDSKKGASLFRKYCVSCHGENGNGSGLMADILTPHPRSLREEDLNEGITDQDLFFTILGGGEAMGLSEQMPGWGDVLSDSEVWDIVKYIRTFD